MKRLALVAMLVAACGRKDAEPPPAPAPRTPTLFSDREVQTLEAAAARRLQSAKTMTCPRAVLHGTPTPGPADADILALAAPSSGLLADCLKDLATVDVSIDFAARTPQGLAYEQQCGEQLAAAVRAIAAHEDGCSPLQIGRAPIPPDQMPMVKAAHVIGFRAGLQHDVWLIADALRAYQDIGRGNVTMVTTMLVSAAYQALADHALVLLATTKLDPRDAAPLVAAFDALLATEPPYAGTVRGELAAMTDNLPAFQNGTTRDAHGLALANVERLEGLMLGACPDTAPYATCLAGLRKLHEELAGRAAAAAGSTSKAASLDEMAARTLPRHDDVLAARARATSALIAVRVALDVARSGACAPPALPGVVKVLGEPLTAHIDTGALRLEPPAFAAKDGVQWSLRCDARARPPAPKNHQ